MTEKNMTENEKLEKVREFFAGDKFAAMAGCFVEEVDENHSVCSMEISDKHRNAYGGIMGGAIFTLADFAAAVVANQDGAKTVANNMNITFVGNTKEDKIIATAVMKKDGRSTSYVEVEILDKNGKQIAYTSVLGFHLK